MLEAFKTTSQAAKPAERSESVSPPLPQVAPANPTAKPTAKSTSTAAPRTDPRAMRRSSDPLAFTRSPIVRLAVLQVALLALAFFIGRWTASASGPKSEVHAETNDPTVAKSPEIATPPAPATKGNATQTSVPDVNASSLRARPANPTPADTALFDPKNKYTVKMIEYQSTEGFAALATGVYEYLRGKGFPVCQPYVSGKSISVMVGAAPGTGDLEKLLDQLKALPGPNGKTGEFKTAYISPIDRIVKRGN